MKPCSLRLLASALALAFATSAHAVVQTFNFNFSGGNNSEQLTQTFTQNGLTVTVTGWSYNAATSSFSQSNVGWYSPGLGVKYSGDDSHTVDNNGRIDFLKFAFAPIPADVNSLSIGYVENYGGSDNSDFTYWLNNTGSLSIAGGTNVNGTGTGSYALNGSSTQQFSYLIVSASVADANLIDPRYGSNYYEGNDGFKISGLNVTTGTSNTPGVPDGGSTAILLGASLAAVGLISRRRTTA